jgi:hypothetical protein
MSFLRGRNWRPQRRDAVFAALCLANGLWLLVFGESPTFQAMVCIATGVLYVLKE